MLSLSNGAKESSSLSACCATKPQANWGRFQKGTVADSLNNAELKDPEESTA